MLYLQFINTEGKYTLFKLWGQESGIPLDFKVQIGY